MNLPSLINFKFKEALVKDILDVNNESIRYGLQLNEEEVLDIVEYRNRVLKNYGRIDFGSEVIKNIINNFSSSPYIVQEEYALIINELQEIFYYVKNESNNMIGDEDLIKKMEELYNNECGGSLELLKIKLEIYCQEFKSSGY